jgi:hypothetical protein
MLTIACDWRNVKRFFYMYAFIRVFQMKQAASLRLDILQISLVGAYDMQGNRPGCVANER